MNVVSSSSNNMMIDSAVIDEEAVKEKEELGVQLMPMVSAPLGDIVTIGRKSLVLSNPPKKKGDDPTSSDDDDSLSSSEEEEEEEEEQKQNQPKVFPRRLSMESKGHASTTSSSASRKRKGRKQRLSFDSDEESSSQESEEPSSSGDEDEEGKEEKGDPSSASKKASAAASSSHHRLTQQPYNPEHDPNLEEKKIILELLTHGANCKRQRRCRNPNCLQAKSMIRHISKCKDGPNCKISYCAGSKFVLINGPQIQKAIVAARTKAAAAATKKQEGRGTTDTTTNKAPSTTTTTVQQKLRGGRGNKTLPGRKENFSLKRKARPQWIPGKLANILEVEEEEEEEEEDWDNSNNGNHHNSKRQQSTKDELKNAIDAFGLSDSESDDEEGSEEEEDEEEEEEEEEEEVDWDSNHGNSNCKRQESIKNELKNAVDAFGLSDSDSDSDSDDDDQGACSDTSTSCSQQEERETNHDGDASTSTTTTTTTSIAPIGQSTKKPPSPPPPPSFIPSKTYRGSKPGYVFTTTKKYGLGYHLDNNNKQQPTRASLELEFPPPTNLVATPQQTGLSVLRKVVEGTTNLAEFIPSETYSGYKLGYVFTTTIENGLGYHLDAMQMEKLPVLESVEGTNLAAFIPSIKYQGYKPGYVFTTTCKDGLGYHLDAVQMKKWPKVVFNHKNAVAVERSGAGMAPAFLPSNRYQGYKPGYVFTTTYNYGLGYHLDAIIQIGMI